MTSGTEHVQVKKGLQAWHAVSFLLIANIGVPYPSQWSLLSK